MVEFAISSLPCSELWMWFAAFLCSCCRLSFSASLSFIFDSPLVVFHSHTNSLKASFPPVQRRIEPGAVRIDWRWRYPNKLEWMADKDRLGWRGTRARRNLGSWARSVGHTFRSWQGEWFLCRWDKRRNRKNIGEDKSCYDLTNSTHKSQCNYALP